MSMANAAAARALAAGTITRRDDCEQCGGTNVVIMHHEDYGLPLDIIWLCAGCHLARHRELRRMGVMPCVPEVDERTKALYAEHDAAMRAKWGDRMITRKPPNPDRFLRKYNRLVADTHPDLIAARARGVSRQRIGQIRRAIALGKPQRPPGRPRKQSAA